MKKTMSLYIHIPFCNSKCNYCSFVSFVSSKEEKLKYIETLKKEIKLQAKLYAGIYSVRTIYIGGGTPSSLPVGAIKDILQTIYKNFTVKNNAEITMELNPNTVNEDKINEYVISGVNRFSIGLQCVSESVLKSMGRTHTVADFDQTLEYIRNLGVSNISADLILGYPGQTEKDVIDSVKYLIRQKVPHISCYMLSVENGTKLKTMVDSGTVYLPSEEKLIKMYQAIVTYLAKAGYDRYEISNFAKPGFTCKHNLVYWKREDYLGFGVAAHSYLNGIRFANTENLQTYTECIEKTGKAPICDVTKLTDNDKKEEFIMLSLRTSEGLDTNEYEKTFGENIIATKKEVITNLIKLGFLSLDKVGILKATSKGFLVLNRIILELCS
ncbi:MAG: radical SAM family heme chaperone HemW [Clostridia bacterium]|nr:radical SAM family heme chaperone HemW [Clostridia bacterium]